MVRNCEDIYTTQKMSEYKGKYSIVCGKLPCQVLERLSKKDYDG